MRKIKNQKVKSKKEKIEIEKIKPIRNAEWTEKKEKGTVEIKLPKFRRKLGNWFCRLLHRSTYIPVNLDEIGSFVWEKCDGEHSFEEILSQMEEKFDEQNLDKRLRKFLYQLERSGLITH